MELNKAKISRFLKESKLDELQDEMITILEDNLDDEISSLLEGSSLAKIREILS